VVRGGSCCGATTTKKVHLVGTKESGGRPGASWIGEDAQARYAVTISGWRDPDGGQVPASGDPPPRRSSARCRRRSHAGSPARRTGQVTVASFHSTDLRRRLRPERCGCAGNAELVAEATELLDGRPPMPTSVAMGARIMAGAPASASSNSHLRGRCHHCSRRPRGRRAQEGVHLRARG
jgi:hypothetical protein